MVLVTPVSCAKICWVRRAMRADSSVGKARSEEHTSELQSRLHLVCRLLLEKKKPYYIQEYMRNAITYQMLLVDEFRKEFISIAVPYKQDCLNVRYYGFYYVGSVIVEPSDI